MVAGGGGGLAGAGLPGGWWGKVVVVAVWGQSGFLGCGCRGPKWKKRFNKSDKQD